MAEVVLNLKEMCMKIARQAVDEAIKERCVVLCKNCKYGDAVEPGMIYCSKGHIVGSYVDNGFFCGYGEEKTDE